MKSQNFETSAFGAENAKKAPSKNPIKSLFTEKLDLVVSALIILTGVCFIVSDAILYFTGGKTPYSAARVMKFLIAPLAFLAVTAVFAVVDGFRKGKRDLSGSGKYTDIANDRLARITKKLLEKFDFDNAPEQVKNELSILDKKRKNTLIIAVSTTVVAIVFSIITLINTDRFTVENINSDIAKAAIVIIFATALSFIAWCFHSNVSFHSLKSQREIIQKAIRETPSLATSNFEKKPQKKFTSVMESDKTKLVIRIVLVTIAVVLIVLGILNGGMADVLSKAVAICMECIGIG